MRHQPDRDGGWWSWLIIVAKREAWSLDAKERVALAAVPERHREVKALWVAGFKYEEITEQLGLTYTRVNRLMTEANHA